MPEFILHTIAGSPYGRSVLALLLEKGAQHRVEGLAPDRFRSPEHLASQPFGRVPWLVHDGLTLYETQAILRYIDRALPVPAFAPADIEAAARMDQILNVCDCYLFVGVSGIIGFNRLIKPLRFNQPADEAAIEAAMPLARTVFAELARLLGAQPYLAGQEISLADFAVAPQLAFLADTPEWADLIAPHARLENWYQRMMARPSFTRTGWQQVAEMTGFR